MTHPALIERITRSLAYMLRHQPGEFDLELDAHGYGDAERIVQALNERLGEPVTLGDLETAIRSGDRPRYEIVGSRVRALYGHSIDVEPGEPTRPPELLFVGISARDADRAMQYGLRGGRRRFLHLALSSDDAKESGRRTGRDYVVITVYALDAWEEGNNFYDRKALFLAGQIPTEFLELTETCHDGVELDERAPSGRREHGGSRPRGGGGRGRGREDHGGHGAHRSEPRGTEDQEEEGFGEGSPAALERERGPAHGMGGHDPRAAGAGRGDGGSGSPRGGRGSRDDRPRENEFSRESQPAARRPDWVESEAAPSRGPRENRGHSEDRRPAPSRQENTQQPGFGDSHPGRGPRDSHSDGGAPTRESERGNSGNRGGRPDDRGERRDRRPERQEYREDRGSRESARPERDAPVAPQPASPATPERSARPVEAAAGPGFGLGIFEEPAARQRQAPAPARQPAPAPIPREPEPRKSDPSEGFGAGV